MIVLTVILPCPGCSGRDDAQPNYCAKCGGRGSLRTTITQAKLRYLPVIPEVLGATQTAPPRRRKAVR